jgi:hypothetical protein
MTYDPVATRATFLRENKWLLKNTLDETYDDSRPMGNVALSDLNTYVRATLVGLGEELAPIISRSTQWLERAIEKDETLGDPEDFHRAQLHWGLAMSYWLRDGARAEGEWAKAWSYLSTTMSPTGISWKRIDDAGSVLDEAMAFLLQAGEYDRGIAEFERYHGPREIKIERTLSPRVLAYAHCLHKVRQQFENAALFSAGRKMLRTRLESEWLNVGQNLHAASWLKIVYGDDQENMGPTQTILRAYENMPHVTRPDFV